MEKSTEIEFAVAMMVGQGRLKRRQAVHFSQPYRPIVGCYCKADHIVCTLAENMDGTKRKLEHDSEAVDLGRTPAYNVPAYLQPESVARAVQPPQSFDLTRFRPYHAQVNIEQRSWPAINTMQPEKAQHPRHYGRRAPSPLVAQAPDYPTYEYDLNDAGDFQVDMDDGHDAVYMHNVAEGSWSRTMDEDEPFPPQLQLALSRLRKAQAEEQIAEDNESLSQPAEAQTDKLLRNLMRQVRDALQAGDTLILDGMRSTTSSLCAYPKCSPWERSTRSETYRLMLKGRAMAFCLTCLERLWAGGGLCGDLPAAEVGEEDCDKIAPQPATSLALDGDRDPMDFHHSAIEIDPDAFFGPPSVPDLIRTSPTPSAAQSPETSGSQDSSHGSLDINGQWRQPVARFQHLAAFIIPGKTLNDQEKALLNLWKAASREQIWWLGHLKQREKLYEHYARGWDDDEEDAMSTSATVGVYDDESEEGGVVEKLIDVDVPGAGGKLVNVGTRVDTATEMVDEEVLEKVAGLMKRDCRGKTLSAVLSAATAPN